MALTRAERERISDSQLKIQAIANSLNCVDPKKIPHYEEIRACLENADKSLGGVLRSSESDAGRAHHSRSHVLHALAPRQHRHHRLRHHSTTRRERSTRARIHASE